jgi:ABC-type dipeptide/oligopeptide/nickel transport system permease component
MLRYIVNRLIFAVPVLLAVLTSVFFIIRIVPGDPAVSALGDYASESAVEALREKMGLNEPLYMQYFFFLRDLLRGDLGTSLISGKSLGDQIGYALPYTLELMAASVLVGTLLGLPLGVLTALNRNSLADYLGRVFSLVGLSMPSFFFAIILMLVFAVKLGVLPAIGGGDLGDPVDNLQHLALPALTLGLIMVASTTRLTRSAMLNVLSEDFVRTARAKGLEERAVIFRHALRAAMVPIVSLIGLWVISLSGGSLIMEVVFSRPGLGKIMVGAVMQRDYTALQSMVVIYTLFVVLVNLLTELIYSLVDPRITH